MERRNLILVLFASIFLVVHNVQCQLTFQETVFVDPENPDRCYDSEIDTYFNLHSVWWRPNQCMRLTCQLGNTPSTMTIVGERCQEYEAPPNCRLVSNQYVLFPGCCPKLMCSPEKIEIPDSGELAELLGEEPPVVEESSKPGSEEILLPPPSTSSEENLEICEENECPSVELVEQVPDIDSISSEMDKFVEDKEVNSVTPTGADTPTDDVTTTADALLDADDDVTTTAIPPADNETTEQAIKDQEGAISNIVEEAEKPLEENNVSSTTTEEPFKEDKPLIAGYESHATGNYKFHTMMVAWGDAKLICESEGTHLAIVNSNEESEVLKKMFAVYPEDFWRPQFARVVFASLGFHDMDKEGEYVTILGDPLNSTGFTRFWGKNEPNNLGAGPNRPGEDCGSLHRNGGLNDFFCMLHLPFICEQ